MRRIAKYFIAIVVLFTGISQFSAAQPKVSPIQQVDFVTPSIDWHHRHRLCRKNKLRHIDGYDDMLVYLGSGLVDLTTDPIDGPTGCISTGQCNGDWFHFEIMGRSAAEMAVLEQLAKDFFLARFGVDVDAMVASGDIDFGTFSTDPRILYRNYMAMGKKIPSGGWEVRDGGWTFTVINPAGIDLGGEFLGRHVGFGTQALFGNYNIAETRNNGKIKNERIIFYRSGSVLEVDADLELSVIYGLSQSGPDFPNGAEGLAIIVAKFYFVGATELKHAIRNVLSFGPGTVHTGLGPDVLLGGCGQTKDNAR